MQNLPAYIILWLLLNSVWGGHKAEPHRLLTSISRYISALQGLHISPFSKCWSREFLQVPDCESLQILAASVSAEPVFVTCATLRLLFRFYWPSLSADRSQCCSLSTRKVPIGSRQLSWYSFLAEIFHCIPELPDVCSNHLCQNWEDQAGYKGQDSWVAGGAEPCSSHWGGKAGACSDLGKFRINTALGECPVQEDQSRAVTHAFSQQLI